VVRWRSEERNLTLARTDKRQLWKFGDFRSKKFEGDFYALSNPAFSEVTRKNMDVFLDGECQVPLPRYLTGNIERHEGVESLTFNCRLEPGYYEFTISFYQWVCKAVRKGPNAEWDSDKTVIRKFHGKDVRYEIREPLARKWVEEVTCQIKSKNPAEKTLLFEEVDECIYRPDRNIVFVELDGKEIALFGEPASELVLADNDTAVTRVETVPFVCDSGGTYRITLRAPRVPAWPITGGTWGRYAGQRFVLNGIGLAQVGSPDPVHSLKSGFPIAPHLDLWGWQMGLTYQREDWNNPPGLAYFKKNVVDESRRWGANFMEFYLTNCIAPRSAPFDWDDDDDYFTYRPSPGWTDATFKKATRYCHEKGMQLHWYEHYPFEDKKTNLESHEAPNPWVCRLNAYTAKTFASSVSSSWLDIIDGLHYESGSISTSVDILKQIHPLWRENPGMNYAESGAGIKSLRVLPALYPGTAAYNSTCNRGPDDMYQINPFGEDYWHSEFGRGFVTGQLNSRDRYYQQYGDIHPDFMLKQINDSIRDYSLNSRQRHVSAFWWLGEAPYVTSPVARRTSYIVSLDPVRCAIAARLESTGKGGTFEQRMRATRNESFYRPGIDYPATTAFVQNNWIRLYSEESRDGFDLWADPTGTAEYDNNSQALCLGEGFLSTVSKASFGEVKKTNSIVEPGGYQAVLHTAMKHKINDPNADFSEEKDLTLNSDSPFLRAVVKRSHQGEQHEVATVIPSRGYDQLWLDGKRIRYNPVARMIGDSPAPECYEAKRIPSRIELADSTGIRPRLTVFVIRPGHINFLQWFPDGNLILWTMNPRKYAAMDLNRRNYHPIANAKEEQEFVVVVGQSLWKSKDLVHLPAMFKSPCQSLRLGQGKRKTVTNRFSVPEVRVVKIEDPCGGPYHVCENGWWIARGAQPSFQDKDRQDFLKLYLSPNAKAMIHRDGLINGIARSGWGCQYTLAIKDPLKKTRGQAALTARVLGLNPFVFAPRVEFARPIAAVKLNGKPWHYFEEQLVFLPNAEGDYRIEVTYGKRRTPALGRTHACITQTAWRNGSLSFTATLPEYQKKLPPSIRLYGLILHDKPITKVRGANIVNNGPRGTILSFKPGTISLRFDNQKENK
jgi:hypothetical protein